MSLLLAQVVLKRMPRHLETYQWLLQAAWQLKQWDEGEEWGRRLLQADPNNALAWRAVARGVEERGERAQSHAIWQRAFEVAPFDPDVRSGLSRTSLEPNAESDAQSGLSGHDLSPWISLATCRQQNIGRWSKPIRVVSTF